MWHDNNSISERELVSLSAQINVPPIICEHSPCCEWWLQWPSCSRRRHMGTREAPRPCLRPAYRNTKEKKLCCSLARNNKGAEEHEEGDLSHPSGCATSSVTMVTVSWCEFVWLLYNNMSIKHTNINALMLTRPLTRLTSLNPKLALILKPYSNSLQVVWKVMMWPKCLVP